MKLPGRCLSAERDPFQPFGEFCRRLHPFQERPFL